MTNTKKSPSFTKPHKPVNNKTDYSVFMKKLSTPQFITLTSIGLGLWWVLTHWGFWEKGLYAIGWNTTVFWFVLVGALIALSQKPLKNNWHWLLPIGLISASFALWENPWLKMFSFLLLPILMGFFFGYSQLKANEKKYLDSESLEYLIERMFSWINQVGAGSKVLTDSGTDKLNQTTKQNLKQAGLGALILLGLSIVIIPLLASVDAKFSMLIDDGFEALSDLIDISLVGKLMVGGVIAVITSALFLKWPQPITLVKGHQVKAPLSEALTSVLFIGLITIYWLFIITQGETLLQGTLPSEFKDTERLVKSGFWQLFFISGINTILFFLFYQRTGRFSQWLLRVFILASTIILLSAAWRMGLYVTLYGFSYEKFFALYTVAFCLALFGYLVYSSFKTSRCDIVKTICFGFLWCFSIATVLPVEAIIFKANHDLATRADSRIELDELEMLSADVYKMAQKYQFGTTPLRYLHLADLEPETTISWQGEVEQSIKSRAWYEYNLSLWINSQSLKK